MILEVAVQTVRSDGAGKSRSKRRKENRRNKRKGNEAAKNTSADNGAGNDYKKTSSKPSILSHVPLPVFTVNRNISTLCFFYLSEPVPIALNIFHM